MRHIVRKLFFVWDYEKEERWINHMAGKGMLLIGVGFGKFVFEEGAKGEYHYRLNWIKHYPSDPESISYIRFLEETGIEHIGSFKKMLFLRKKSCEGDFILYSDLDSKASHFKRLLTLMTLLLALILGGIFYELVMFAAFREEMALTSLMLAFMGLLLASLLIGLKKTLRQYRNLKKERLLRE